MRVGALRLKLQLICGDGYAMGPGKADILAAIDQHGSISAAGRALGMSYRRTWLLVDEMNRSFRDPLVDAQAGGSSARGAHLTDQGRIVLAAYRDLEQRSAVISDSAAYRQLAELVRDTPLPRKPAG